MLLIRRGNRPMLLSSADARENGNGFREWRPWGGGRIGVTRSPSWQRRSFGACRSRYA